MKFNVIFFLCVSIVFISFKIPRGGFAHLWCLVFSGNPDVGYHITARKVSILDLLGFYAKLKRFWLLNFENLPQAQTSIVFTVF